MALLEKGVHAVSDRMPKVISPKLHAILDYGVVASFMVVGIKSLRRGHTRAAAGSFMVAGSELITALLTDYPGGVAEVIDFPTHLKIDAGLAGVIASMPNAIGFGKGWQSWFFRGRALSIAAISGLTSTTEFAARRERRPLRVA